MGIWEVLEAPLFKIIDKVIPDRAASQVVKDNITQMQAQGGLAEELTQLQAVTSAQSDINKVEAASSSVFVAGWRPFVGWVCGVGLAMSCIVSPLLTWVSTLVGHPTPFPKLDDPILRTTLAGMLGLGYGLRTLEKFNGVQGNH